MKNIYIEIDKMSGHGILAIFNSRIHPDSFKECVNDISKRYPHKQYYDCSIVESSILNNCSGLYNSSLLKSP